MKIKRCAVCGNWSYHRFDGIQDLPSGDLRLYTSSCCEATQTEPVQRVWLYVAAVVAVIIMIVILFGGMV